MLIILLQAHSVIKPQQVRRQVQIHFLFFVKLGLELCLMRVYYVDEINLLSIEYEQFVLTLPLFSSGLVEEEEVDL